PPTGPARPRSRPRAAPARCRCPCTCATRRPRSRASSGTGATTTTRTTRPTSSSRTRTCPSRCATPASTSRRTSAPRARSPGGSRAGASGGARSAEARCGPPAPGRGLARASGAALGLHLAPRLHAQPGGDQAEHDEGDAVEPERVGAIEELVADEAVVAAPEREGPEHQRQEPRVVEGVARLIVLVLLLGDRAFALPFLLARIRHAASRSPGSTPRPPGSQPRRLQSEKIGR